MKHNKIPKPLFENSSFSQSTFNGIKASTLRLSTISPTDPFTKTVDYADGLTGKPNFRETTGSKTSRILIADYNNPSNVRKTSCAFKTKTIKTNVHQSQCYIKDKSKNQKKTTSTIQHNDQTRKIVSSSKQKIIKNAVEV